jgi:Cu/Ag efflux pump CusA
MVQINDQLVALNRSQLEATLRFTQIASEAVERFAGLQFQAAKSAFADGVKTAKQLGAVKEASELAAIGVNTGASFIYRQDNSRYIGVQYSVEGRDLAGAVQDAQKQVARQVKLPSGYHIAWGGEYEEYTASRGQLQIVIPVTLALIFLLLFSLYQNFKFPAIPKTACR